MSLRVVSESRPCIVGQNRRRRRKLRIDHPNASSPLKLQKPHEHLLAASLVDHDLEGIFGRSQVRFVDIRVRPRPHHRGPAVGGVPELDDPGVMHANLEVDHLASRQLLGHRRVQVALLFVERAEHLGEAVAHPAAAAEGQFGSLPPDLRSRLGDENPQEVVPGGGESS